jgi:hypothetical protein
MLSAQLYPVRKKPGIHWIGGWLHPRSNLGTVEDKNLLPMPGIKPRVLGHSTYSLVNILNKYYILGHYPSSCLYLKCRPVYVAKHNVSETGFCLRLQVTPTQIGTSSIYWTQLNRCYLKTVTEVQSLKHCLVTISGGRD